MAMMQRTLNRLYRYIPAIKYYAHSRSHTNSSISLKSKQNHYQDNGTYFLFYASIPPFLAFFKKKEEETDDEQSFLEKILPEDVFLLLKKLPEEDEETPEGKLKTTMKRTILCIHRGEYKKAEQMAHLALRMAQEMQHYDGITFVYDVLGNLAYERNQYEKAEKLFVTVLQRLIQKNVSQDDVRVLHLSLKVAQLVELQGKSDEAKTNYIWTITKLEEKLKREQQDDDLHELWGLANNSYGKFLLSHGKFAEAKDRLQNSHDVYVKYRGRSDPDFVNLLNDLAVVCSHTNNLDEAEKYINEAIMLGSVFPEMYESGVYHANKGMIFLRKNLVDQASSMCKYAEKMANRSKDPDGHAQAKYCLEQIEEALKGGKN